MRGTWLCPTELDRARVVDNSDRIRRARRLGSLAVGAALLLLVPTYGWWIAGLFAASALNLLTLDRRLEAAERPERVVAGSLLFTEVLIAIGVAGSGAGASPMLPWLAIPIGMSAVRFRLRVVVAGAVIGLSMGAAATFVVDPASVLDHPAGAIVTVALIVNVVAVAAALQEAELFHRKASVLDSLTGLLNRKALAPRFAEVEQQAHLAGGVVSLIAIDLDAFKRINDDHGHDRGDAVLQEVAYEMRKSLRHFELFYRLGGEEFLVLLPGVDRDDAAEVAERLRRAVEELNLGDLSVTVSAGVATASGDGVEFQRLFAAADAALYQAKEAGRNRVVVASGTEETQPADKLDRLLASVTSEAPA
jgi:diguanylate cyclase (GGDEF)-like protein